MRINQVNPDMDGNEKQRDAQDNSVWPCLTDSDKALWRSQCGPWRQLSSQLSPARSVESRRAVSSVALSLLTSSSHLPMWPSPRRPWPSSDCVRGGWGAWETWPRAGVRRRTSAPGTGRDVSRASWFETSMADGSLFGSAQLAIDTTPKEAQVQRVSRAVLSEQTSSEGQSFSNEKPNTLFSRCSNKRAVMNHIWSTRDLANAHGSLTPRLPPRFQAKCVCVFFVYILLQCKRSSHATQKSVRCAKWMCPDHSRPAPKRRAVAKGVFTASSPASGRSAATIGEGSKHRGSGSSERFGGSANVGDTNPHARYLKAAQEVKPLADKSCKIFIAHRRIC